MPRLYVTLLDDQGECEESCPVDLCQSCYEDVDGDDDWAKDNYGFNRPEKEAVDWNCDHPPYEDDPDMYSCCECDRTLETKYDNYEVGDQYYGDRDQVLRVQRRPT